MRTVRYLMLTAALLVAGCSSSTLPEDDQAFCAEQEDHLGPAAEAVDQIINGDRHWSSEGEPLAMRGVYVDPASDFVSAFDAQDADLAGRVKEVSSALFYLGSDLLNSDAAFLGDAASSRDAARAIESLQEFCDENG